MEPINYIQAREISKAYGEKVLFSQISMSISQGQKVALIARNGTGKTTLMNILAGKDEADEGLCSYKSGLRIAYLPQQPVFDPGLTVSQALLSADNEQTEAIRAYEELISESPDSPSGTKDKELQAIIERMDALQAWDYEQKVKQVLGMLKIGTLKARVEELSGGQLKRLALARILIEEADLLLLDEPTNHLDMEMIEWLENFLSRQKTTLLMVTHDRYFLDAVCNHIMELENGQIYNYTGNYTRYLEKKQERLHNEAAGAEKATNLLRRETEWMRRTPQARTTKSKSRIQAYYDLKDKAHLQQESQAGDIRMDMTRLGKKILELEGVSKSFDETAFVNNFSYVFKRGERVGLVGANGTGKTTLLNLITGHLAPDSGTITTGETIRFGYYRQDGLQVDDDKKVIEVITEIAERIQTGKDQWMSAAQFLRHFNFPNHMHHDRVGKLSGGEKRRLYLLTVLMKSPNFLILDEPTNDLDIHTLNLLEDFLMRYGGCLLVVSHDRYFLDRLVDHLFVFRGPGDIKDFPGNYTQYRLHKPVPEKGSGQESEKPAATDSQTRPRQKTKRSYKEQKEFEQLETDMARLEKEKAVLLEKMNSGALSPDELLKASARFTQVESLLDTMENRWLELSEYVQ